MTLATLPYLRRVRVEIMRHEVVILAVDESLRISFSIQRKAQPDPQASVVRLYNLSDRAELRIRERYRVRIEAGYGTGPELGLLGEGDIRRIKTETVGLDRVTTITFGAADVQRLTGEISRAYPGLVPIRTIVIDIVRSLGFGLGPMDVIPEDIIERFSFGGAATEALTRLLEPRDVRWYEVNGEVHFARRSRSAMTAQPLVVISEQTGLIGSPIPTEIGARAKVLLNTNVELGTGIELRSNSLNGRFTVSSVTHRGDTHDGEFVTELEAHTIEEEDAP